MVWVKVLEKDSIDINFRCSLITLIISNNREMMEIWIPYLILDTLLEFVSFIFPLEDVDVIIEYFDSDGLSLILIDLKFTTIFLVN